MGFTPFWYQAECINASLNFLTDKKVMGNGLAICPTASGKSLIIANIAKGLDGMVVIFQPSKEILQQNFEKFLSYEGRGGIYSASAGIKHVDRITYVTIGSVAKKHHLFRDVKYIIIDECHLVSADAGMYINFINAHPGVKVLGLTATPYRLSSGDEGAMLKFLNRTNPRIFNRVVYFIQNKVLFDGGFVAPLRYFDMNLIKTDKLILNTKGTDFTDSSLREYYRTNKMAQKTIAYGNRILAKRANLLVFCSLVSEANEVAKGIPGAVVLHGETEPRKRDIMLKNFKAGLIKCVVNVGVLVAGFDYPALEAVLIARKTMSLAMYYQMIGRVMRKYKYPDGTIKEGWVIDLGGNITFFGKVETMIIIADKGGKYSVWNTEPYRQLTNVPFQRQ